MQAAFESGMAVDDGLLCGLLSLKSWMSLVRVLVFGVVEVLRSWTLEMRPRGTQMVNAAQMVGHTGKLAGKVIVVDV